MGRKRKPPNEDGSVGKKHRVLPPCRVCGGPAAGFHYGANTCEACKGFFHRSIRKHSTYKCDKTGDCIIVHTETNLCQMCRFNKCIAIGMSKTAIKTGRYTDSKRSKDRQELMGLMARNTSSSFSNTSETSFSLSSYGFTPTTPNRPSSHSSASPLPLPHATRNKEEFQNTLFNSQQSPHHSNFNSSTENNFIGADTRHMSPSGAITSQANTIHNSSILPGLSNNFEKNIFNFSSPHSSCARLSGENSTFSCKQPPYNIPDNSSESCANVKQEYTPSDAFHFDNSCRSVVFGQSDNISPNHDTHQRLYTPRSPYAHYPQTPVNRLTVPSADFFDFLDRDQVSLQTPHPSQPSQSNRSSPTINHTQLPTMPRHAHISNTDIPNAQLHTTPSIQLALQSSVLSQTSPSNHDVQQLEDPPTLTQLTPFQPRQPAYFSSENNISSTHSPDTSDNRLASTYHNNLQLLANTPTSSDEPDLDDFDNGSPNEPGPADSCSCVGSSKSNLVEVLYTNMDRVIASLMKARTSFIDPLMCEKPKEELNKLFQDHLDACRLTHQMFGPMIKLPDREYDYILENTGIDSDGRMKRYENLMVSMEKHVRSMVKFAKSVPAFRHLDIMDKVNLIKQSRVEFMFVNSYHNVDPKIRVALLGDNRVRCSLCICLDHTAEEAEKVSQLHMDLCAEFQRLKLTREEEVVLQAMTLVAPNRFIPVNDSTVGLIHTKLQDCLWHVAQARGDRAHYMYHSILELNKQLRHYSDYVLTLIKSFGLQKYTNVSQNPLMQEMLGGVLFDCGQGE